MQCIGIFLRQWKNNYSFLSLHPIGWETGQTYMSVCLIQMNSEYHKKVFKFLRLTLFCYLVQKQEKVKLFFFFEYIENYFPVEARQHRFSADFNIVQTCP